MARITYARSMGYISIRSTTPELKHSIRRGRASTATPFACRQPMVKRFSRYRNCLVAWFQLTKSSSQREVMLLNESMTLSGSSIDYRTVLGSVAFSKGVHYWEVTVDRHEANADIVLGVAQPSVNRHTMLGTNYFIGSNIFIGKDLHGWSMYLDAERSWYLHNDQHHGRISGGILGPGTVIGVLIDCDQGLLVFYMNDNPLVFEGQAYAFK